MLPHLVPHCPAILRFKKQMLVVVGQFPNECVAVGSCVAEVSGLLTFYLHIILWWK